MQLKKSYEPVMAFEFFIGKYMRGKNLIHIFNEFYKKKHEL